MRFWWPTLACVAALSLFAESSAAAKYRPQRLEDGHPDLQGVWDFANATPLERPPGIATLKITPEQAADIARAWEQFAEDRSIPTEPTEYAEARRLLPVRGELRSSIIIDPPDGRIPGTAAFRQWQRQARDNLLHAFDGPEQRPTSERCLGNPAAQPPSLSNPAMNLHQIVQTSAAVLIEAESMHFARIVRLDSTHAPAAVTSWSGDSIGWWEGDTLVVETKHFTPSDTGRETAGMLFRISPAATVIERITRIAADELSYVFTVDDPANYTRPWTGETILVRKNENLLEYACHEANYSLRFVLQGGRARDAQ